jgi:hypothetical protein
MNLGDMLLKEKINDNGLRSTSNTSLKSITQSDTELTRRYTEDILSLELPACLSEYDEAGRSDSLWLSV